MKNMNNKMNMKLWALLASVILVSACNPNQSNSSNQNTQNTQNNQVAASSSSDSSSSPANSQASQANSTNQDNQENVYVDESGKKYDLPEDVNASEITKFKHDEKNNITVYAVKYEQKNADKKELVNQLEKSLKENPTQFKGMVHAGDEKDTKISYEISELDSANKPILNESCILDIQAEHIDNICAYSPTAEMKDLSNAIKEFSK